MHGPTRICLRARTLFAALLVTPLALAACSPPSLDPNQLGLAAMPKLPDMSELPKLPKMPSPPPPIIGSPTDVYTNVARGALTCWFGAKGPLKGQYIYHGEANPPSKGGRAVIVIHLFDPAAPSPRGLRAYQIVIAQESPEVERTAVVTENLKMPEPLASRMADDVRRWAAAETGCGEQPTAASWAPGEPSAAETAKGTSTAGRPSKRP